MIYKQSRSYVYMYLYYGCHVTHMLRASVWSIEPHSLRLEGTRMHAYGPAFPLSSLVLPGCEGDVSHNAPVVAGEHRARARDAV